MKGLVHIYTGDGKGKTTAALGLALRAAGCGRRVLIVQFFKGRDSGELRALGSVPNIAIRRLKNDYGFFKAMDEADKAAVRAEHDALLTRALAEAQTGACDTLILDEAISAFRHGAMDRERLERFLDCKPEALELVLTGRDAPPQLLERADYVTDMRKLKHPFDQGIPAREGVEF
jgi:cob(I)alamin adenosyltransferase